jgi:hypothetical protein
LVCLDGALVTVLGSSSGQAHTTLIYRRTPSPSPPLYGSRRRTLAGAVLICLARALPSPPYAVVGTGAHPLSYAAGRPAPPPVQVSSTGSRTAPAGLLQPGRRASGGGLGCARPSGRGTVRDIVRPEPAGVALRGDNGPCDPRPHCPAPWSRRARCSVRSRGAPAAGYVRRRISRRPFMRRGTADVATNAPARLPCESLRRHSTRGCTRARSGRPYGASPRTAPTCSGPSTRILLPGPLCGASNSMGRVPRQRPQHGGRGVLRRSADRQLPKHGCRDVA